MLFNRQALLVKERVGFLKLTDVYDLLDPETGAALGQVRDEPSHAFKYLRLLVKKILLPDGREVGVITKKWAGIGKEFFTSADTYMVALSPVASSFPKAMESLLAISIAIDAVHKENN